MTTLCFVGIPIDQVTVVVPTKNESANIDRFLASIPPSVALVVVDSSSDETAAIIASTRPLRTVVIEGDTNIPSARQLGARTATTRWLLFTDADVVFGDDYFDELASVPVEPRCGGIVGVKGTTGGFDRYHRAFERSQAALMALGIPAATGSNMLIRRAALVDVGGFDLDLSVNEDTEVMFRVARAGWKVDFRPQLGVRSFDHRRLERGVVRKVVHGAIRNTALYFGLFRRYVRRSDWGYWQPERSTIERRAA